MEIGSFTETQQQPDGVRPILKKPNPGETPSWKPKTNKRNKSSVDESARKKTYTGFYADYCSSSSSSSCPCHQSFADLDLVTSYLRQITCISKNIQPRKEPNVSTRGEPTPIPPGKPPNNVPKSDQSDLYQPNRTCTDSMIPCGPSDEKSERCDLSTPRTDSMIPCGPSDEKSERCDLPTPCRSSASSDTSVESNFPPSSRTEATEDDEQESDNLDTHFSHPKMDSQKCCCPKCPVAFTSSVMVLFYAAFVTYTIGVNLAEYICYRGGLHGCTFFLVPYLFRFLTIGFVLMTDFFSFLSCPYDVPCFVDLLFRIFMFSFFTASCWNIIEMVMETNRVHPLVYFGLSGGLFFLAMYSFFRLVNLCQNRG